MLKEEWLYYRGSPLSTRLALGKKLYYAKFVLVDCYIVSSTCTNFTNEYPLLKISTSGDRTSGGSPAVPLVSPEFWGAEKMFLCHNQYRNVNFGSGPYIKTCFGCALASSQSSRFRFKHLPVSSSKNIWITYLAWNDVRFISLNIFTSNSNTNAISTPINK